MLYPLYTSMVMGNSGEFLIVAFDCRLRYGPKLNQRFFQLYKRLSIRWWETQPWWPFWDRKWTGLTLCWPSSTSPWKLWSWRWRGRSLCRSLWRRPIQHSSARRSPRTGRYPNPCTCLWFCDQVLQWKLILGGNILYWHELWDKIKFNMK